MNNFIWESKTVKNNKKLIAVIQPRSKSVGIAEFFLLEQLDLFFALFVFFTLFCWNNLMGFCYFWLFYITCYHLFTVDVDEVETWSVGHGKLANKIIGADYECRFWQICKPQFFVVVSIFENEPNLISSRRV